MGWAPDERNNGIREGGEEFREGRKSEWERGGGEGERLT